MSRLLAFYQGNVSGDELDQITAHLAGCAICTGQFEVWQRESESNDITIGTDHILPSSTAPTAPIDDESGKQAGRDEPSLSNTDALIAGRYKLLEPIGQGGMGVVYRAQQVEPVRRLVAIKLIKEGMDTRQVLARFEAERQALALMDHPNIARVLDGGTTPTGRPYFVMELVRGVPITTYCDDHRLNTRARLDLFIAACRAIQHAHQKGIIHRDIKPSNVLVARFDGCPVVKVIDFGIAKAVGQPLTASTFVTNFGAVVGTLEYMSPEQAGLDEIDIDTRSDVYSLGILLYELLTGSTPLERGRIGQAALFEVLRLVREEEPPRPSTRLSSSESLPTIAVRRDVEPARLALLIRGDLDWIAMKALDKDRARRYETANGLARDIERFLNDEPVEASPPSARYRLGKFARRHQRALQASFVVAGLLILATVVSTDQAIRAARAEARERSERSIAEARYTLAREAIETFYTGVSADVLLREPQMRDLRTRLLDAALQFYRKLQDQRDSTDSDQASTPDRSTTEAQVDLARGFERLADVTRQVGDPHAALAGFERALPIRRALLAAAPTASGPHRDLAELDRNLGRVVLEIGPPEAAASWHEQAAAEFAIAASLEGGTDGDQLQAAAARVSAGEALARTVRTVEAATAFERAITDLRRLATARPIAFEPRRALAAALLQAGYLRVNVLPRPLEAIPLVDESNAIHERLTAERGDNMEIKLYQDWADGLHHAAMCREQIGPIESALPFYRRSLEVLERVHRRYPTLTAIRRAMADARIGIGSVLAELAGRERESLTEYDHARVLLEPLAAENPTISSFRARLAAAISSRAYSLDRLGDYDGAIETYGQSIALRERLAREQPTITFFQSILGEDLGHLGDAHHHARHTAEALQNYRRAIAMLSNLQGANVFTRYNLASYLGGTATLLDPDDPDRPALIDRALTLLREVTDSGFRDVEDLMNDPNHAILLPLLAFQLIHRDMEFPVAPFADE